MKKYITEDQCLRIIKLLEEIDAELMSYLHKNIDEYMLENLNIKLEGLPMGTFPIDQIRPILDSVVVLPKTFIDYNDVTEQLRKYIKVTTGKVVPGMDINEDTNINEDTDIDEFIKAKEDEQYRRLKQESRFIFWKLYEVPVSTDQIEELLNKYGASYERFLESQRDLNETTKK